MKEVNPLLFACHESYYDWISTGFHMNRADAIRLLETGGLHDSVKFRNNVFCAAMNREYNRIIDNEPGMNRLLPDLKYHIQGLTKAQALSDSLITPFTDGCRYRKVSPKAAKFLLGLGAPTDDLIRKYRDYLRERVKDGERHQFLPGHWARFHEELVMVPLNGKYEYFYVCASEDNCIFLHQRAPKCGEHEYKIIPLSFDMETLNPKGSALSYDEKYVSGTAHTVDDIGKCLSTAETIFDVESFLANLWISEVTGTCVKAYETAEERKPMTTMCALRNVKPMKASVAYNYIHITDSAWTRYTEADVQIRSIRADSTYTKASWYVRPHYALRHEKMVLVRGHFAYRKAGRVISQPAIDVIL